MKIKTQFIISMALFGVMLLVIATSVIVTNQQVERLNTQEEIAHNLEREASELRYLANDFLLYRESQQRTRWESKSSSFSDELSKLRPNTPEQLVILDSIKGDEQRLKAVFADVVSTLENASRPRDPAADQVLVQTSSSRMAVQDQAIFFDASRLSQALSDQADQVKQANTTLIFALLGLFGAYFLTNYFTIYRRTLRSISDLQAGTKIIGSGNLDFAIAVRRKDEIGELSQAFNSMAASLKGITASKTELEREIAERKQAEEQRQRLLEVVERRAAELDVANKELESFSYSVSHDLRAPLRHIDGFSQILLQDYADKLDEQGQKYLLFVRSGSQRMGQLIDDLLKISRVTRVEMRQERVDLSELAQSIATELRQGETERLVEFVITPDVAASGDPNLLRLVLQNLLGNAWKFTSRREVARIEFGVTQVNGRPAYYVRDNGAGFDMAYADKLFGPFQRLHKEEEFPGTGIGLASVQRIIHRHGGRVWAEGAMDQGAVFNFTLPEP